MTLTGLPKRITVGDTITWDESLADFPASDSWVVSYNFTSRVAQFSSGHAIVDVDDHRITIDTSELEEGKYDMRKRSPIHLRHSPLSAARWKSNPICLRIPLAWIGALTPLLLWKTSKRCSRERRRKTKPVIL